VGLFLSVVCRSSITLYYKLMIESSEVFFSFFVIKSELGRCLGCFEGRDDLTIFLRSLFFELDVDGCILFLGCAC